MVNTPDYPYAHGDLLEQRHDYFYSEFRGAAFLDAWRASRAAALHILEQQSARACAAYVEAPAGSTLRRLRALHEALAKDPGTADRVLLDRLVQRFEVSKRLHGAYDLAFKPVDALDYRDLRLYVMFAQVLAAAAAAWAPLSYLNALLKCMDILTAAVAHVPASHNACMRHLLRVEDDLVKAVQGRVGGAQGC